MSTPDVYQLKITLAGRVSIWRRLQVTGDTPLAGLHRILQVVMGWTDSHLHRFDIYDQFGDLLDLPEATCSLAQLGLRAADGRFGYEYDFGDRWQHEVEVEKILPLAPGQYYPVCLSGRCACPPEDVGGVYGYAHFLQARRNRRHPDHAYYREWAGARFNPAAFSVAEVNRRLRADPSIPGTGDRTAAPPRAARAPKTPDPELVALARAVIALVEAKPQQARSAWLRMEAALNKLPRRIAGRGPLQQLARAARIYCEQPPWSDACEEAYETMTELVALVQDELETQPKESQTRSPRIRTGRH